jgi:hypothetical protein
MLLSLDFNIRQQLADYLDGKLSLRMCDLSRGQGLFRPSPV